MTNVNLKVTKMDLTQFGLTAKEALFYNELISKGPMTVKALSAANKEQRTNCYVILKSLESQQLVERDDLHAVLRFRAKDPANLRNILAKKQSEVQIVNKNLTQSLPKLQALYKLTTEVQGVAYFEDVEGYKAVQDDMLTANTVKSFISDTIVHERPDMFGIIKKYVQLRSDNQVKSYFLSCSDIALAMRSDHLRYPNVEVRSVNTDIFDGEITIYNNKIALTSYEKQRLSTLVISNDAQLKTFLSIFEAVWSQAKILN